MRMLISYTGVLLNTDMSYSARIFANVIRAGSWIHLSVYLPAKDCNFAWSHRAIIDGANIDIFA